MTYKQSIEKSISIEKALQKMGWKVEQTYSGSEGSNSFYMTISKEFEGWEPDDPTTWNKDKVFKIRFSDHDLPAYYSLPDYDCRFDINVAAWSVLKPKLAKLFRETV